MSIHSPLAARFILHFGEMGSRWGVNRTVGQIYALLFISNRPMHADEIVETLHMSRSNVGLGLKELQAWKLTRLQHLPGDRRDYYVAPQDVWDIFATLVEERRRREAEERYQVLVEQSLVGIYIQQDEKLVYVNPKVASTLGYTQEELLGRSLTELLDMPEVEQILDEIKLGSAAPAPPVLIVQATIRFAIAILAEAALSYLGLGTQPPQPSWGRMLSEAQTLMFQAPLLAVFPGLAIAFAVLGLNLLGDGLRDLLDPRLARKR